MLTVNIVTVGKLKEQYLRDASAEYEKRLKAFCKMNITELSESRLPDNPSDAVIKRALDEEAFAMEGFFSKKAFNIAMCIEGRQLSSEELSQKIESISLNGYGTMNIFIGSSFGLSEKVKERCDMRLSMSKMTFPHQLARVMLLEQVYRAFQISSGGKYHK